jgi:monofunctional biosynthetic peptidoglycan transglycosylase
VWRRLKKIAAWTVGGFFALTVLSVVLMRFVPPVTSAFIVHAYLTAWAEGDFRWRAHQSWVPYDQISANVKIAVIASEDQKFPTHYGFDLEQIDQAIEERESGRRVRGASTISQQVAKNLYLWPGQSFVRKGLEAYLTLLLESLWPKQRILEIYLNFAEFGPGIYGVGAAGPHYFRHSPAQLTPTEGALLAAVLPSPKHLKVDRPSAYVQRRIGTILAQEASLGGISYLRKIDADAPGKSSTAEPASSRHRSSR